ncbi:MAG: hypothetical protein JKY65_18145 [Planctomycetes bacterium]|nr:hypothetical protein [Planctomycetota bacterium]
MHEWPPGLPDEAFARRVLAYFARVGPGERKFVFVAPLRLVARDSAGARRVDLAPLWDRYQLVSERFQDALEDFARAARLQEISTAKQEQDADEGPFKLCPLIRTRAWHRAVRAAATDTASLSYPLADDLTVILGRELLIGARPLRREEVRNLDESPRDLLANAVSKLGTLEHPEDAGPAHQESCLLLFSRLGWRMALGAPELEEDEAGGDAP